MHWSQPQPWKVKPDIVLSSSSSSSAGTGDNDNPGVFDPQDITHHAQAVECHLLSLASAYALGDGAGQRGQRAKGQPRLYLVNLIDKKGDQGMLGRLWHMVLLALHKKNALASEVAAKDDWEDRGQVSCQDLEAALPGAGASPDLLPIRYIWMDYHYTCKHEGVEASMRKLYASLEAALLSSAAFFLSCPDEEQSRPRRHIQQSLIRTNCIDCLDRTNVAQVGRGRAGMLTFLFAISKPGCVRCCRPQSLAGC